MGPTVYNGGNVASCNWAYGQGINPALVFAYCPMGWYFANPGICVREN